MILFKKSAVAFFFLFFLYGTSIGTRQQGISYNRRALRRFTFVKRSFSEVRLFSERRLAHFAKRPAALCRLKYSRQLTTSKKQYLNYGK